MRELCEIDVAGWLLLSGVCCIGSIQTRLSVWRPLVAWSGPCLAHSSSQRLPTFLPDIVPASIDAFTTVQSAQNCSVWGVVQDAWPLSCPEALDMRGAIRVAEW